MKPPPPTHHYSTSCAPGDRVGPVVLLERLPSSGAEERWRATLALCKGPPVTVLATATASEPASAETLDRWLEGTTWWQLRLSTVDSIAAVPAKTPGTGGSTAPDELSQEALHAISEVWSALGRSDLEQAIGHAEQAWEKVGRQRGRRFAAGVFELLYLRVPVDHPDAARAAFLRARELAEKGSTQEAFEIATQGLERSSSVAHTHGRLNYVLAMLALRREEPEQAEDFARAAIALVDAAHDHRYAASARSALALVLLRRAERGAAESLFREALERARRGGHRRTEAIVYSNYARLLRETGRWEEGRRCLLAGLQIARADGADVSVGIALANLAGLLVDSGHERAALARFHEVIERSRASGRQYSEAIARGNLGGLLIHTGALDEAETHTQAALAHHREAGAKRGETSMRLQLTRLEIARARPEVARAHLEAAVALGSPTDGLSRWYLARIRILEGAPVEQLLPDLDDALETLWTANRAKATDAAFETAALVVGARARSARARVAALAERIERSTVVLAADRLRLASLWLDVEDAASTHATLAAIDTADHPLTTDQSITANALRVRLALLVDLPGQAHEALSRADAAARSLLPATPFPRTQLALETARRALETATATCPLRGGYRLLRMLGEGGEGRVWEAVAADDSGRVVALKELKGDGRLEREARLGGRLRHRHLVDVYGVGVDDGVAWCAMEACDGGPLTAYLPLPPRAVVEAGLQICEALTYANDELGLVHLDLKPDNLLLAGGAVKVADLGIAYVPADPTGRVSRGTPGYMAPEQRTGAPVDARTDLWAMGVVLTELATGRASSASATYAWTTSPSNDPVPSEPPAWLAPIVDRCLAPAPEDRFGSAAALAEALRALPVVGPGLADVVGGTPSLHPPGELFGRQAELAAIQTAHDANEIAVLEGPFGVGKTALALAALGGRRARGERTVRCDAAGVRDQATLTAALQSVLGPALHEALATFGDGVVLLDGVDQETAVDAVTQFRSRAPGVRWLLTSRLALPGAHRARIEVTPLSPEDGHHLFVARARARGADASDTAAISALVRRLGGLPLALELAAGRLGVYTAAELAEQLDPSWLRSADPSTETSDLQTTLTSLHDELSPACRQVLSVLADHPDGMELGALAHEQLSDGTGLWRVVDDLLSRSLVARVGERFRVPPVLAWALRQRER